VVGVSLGSLVPGLWVLDMDPDDRAALPSIEVVQATGVVTVAVDTEVHLEVAVAARRRRTL
jgi:hypothetical protein